MKNKKGLFWIITGLLLITAALSLTVYNMYDEHRAKTSALYISEQLHTQLPRTVSASDPTSEVSALLSEQFPIGAETSIPDYILNPEMGMPAKTVNGMAYVALLEIPSLGLELPVAETWSNSNLKSAPCRYEGSAYTNDLVIAAHNYVSHFGPLSNLHPGDTIQLTDMDGNVFLYEMVQRETLGAYAHDEMIGGNWALTLFTCTMDGSNRITIRCDLVSATAAKYA